MTAQLRNPGSSPGAAKRSFRGLRGVVAAGAVTALLLGTAGTASAAPGDTDSDTTVVNVVVLGGITLTGLTPTITLTGAPGTAVSAPVSYTVFTNNIAGYAVTVQPSGDLEPATAGNPDTIPITDLLVNTAPLTGGSDTVQGTTAKSLEEGDAYTDTYSMTIPYVSEDTYTTTLTYTATSL